MSRYLKVKSRKSKVKNRRDKENSIIEKTTKVNGGKRDFLQKQAKNSQKKQRVSESNILLRAKSIDFWGFSGTIDVRVFSLGYAQTKQKKT